VRSRAERSVQSEPDRHNGRMSDHVEPEPGERPGKRRSQKGDANLSKASVVNVSQVLTVDKSESGLYLLFDCV